MIFYNSKCALSVKKPAKSLWKGVRGDVRRTKGCASVRGNLSSERFSPSNKYKLFIGIDITTLRLLSYRNIFRVGVERFQVAVYLLA